MRKHRTVLDKGEPMDLRQIQGRIFKIVMSSVPSGLSPCRAMFQQSQLWGREENTGQAIEGCVMEEAVEKVYNESVSCVRVPRSAPSFILYTVFLNTSE